MMNLGLFGFVPPEPSSAEGIRFHEVLKSSPYLMPLITLAFIVCGVSNMLGIFSALSTLILLPISVNILLFHSFMGGGGLVAAIVFFAVNLYLCWYHKEVYSGILRVRN